MQAANTKVSLILLPGLDGTEIFFAPLLRHLPEWVEPVIVTYPQNSHSTYDKLLPLVMQKIAGLESFVLLGWSFGGPLALMAAAELPAQTRGVILCNTFVSSPRRWLAPLRFTLIPPVVYVVRAVRRLRLFIPGYATPELCKAKAATWRAVSASGLAARARAAVVMDARKLLQTCNTQLMYLSASRDEVISHEHLHEVMQLAPHILQQEIDGPHLALFTNPTQSADCIINFIQQQTGTQ